VRHNPNDSVVRTNGLERLVMHYRLKVHLTNADDKPGAVVAGCGGQLGRRSSVPGLRPTARDDRSRGQMIHFSDGFILSQDIVGDGMTKIV
jgi:hypothetical protein